MVYVHLRLPPTVPVPSSLVCLAALALRVDNLLATALATTLLPASTTDFSPETSSSSPSCKILTTGSTAAALPSQAAQY